eukprot:gene1894-2577_t
MSVALSSQGPKDVSTLLERDMCKQRKLSKQFFKEIVHQGAPFQEAASFQEEASYPVVAFLLAVAYHLQNEVHPERPEVRRQHPVVSQRPEGLLQAVQGCQLRVVL